MKTEDVILHNYIPLSESRFNIDLQWFALSDDENDKLSLITYNQPFQATVPSKDSTLDADDNQHLIWQYSGVLWTGGSVKHSLEGSTDSVSLLSGKIDVKKDIAGLTDSVSLLSGVLDLTNSIEGSTDSISLSSGAINLKNSLVGSSDSISLLSGLLNQTHLILGSTDSV